MGPLPAIALSFAAGALAGAFLPCAGGWPGTLLAACCAALAASLWRRGARWCAAALLGAFFCAGLAAGGGASGRAPPGRELLDDLASGRLLVLGEAASPPREREGGGGAGIELDVRSLVRVPGGTPAGAARVSFPPRIRLLVDGAAGEGIEEGDLLLVRRAAAREPRAFRNPDGDGPGPGRSWGPPLFTAGDGDLLVQARAGGLMERARARLSRELSKKLSPRTAGFVEAVVSGRRAHLDRRLADDFRRSGLMHLLAVSGLHLSVLAVGAGRLLGWACARLPAVAARMPAQWAATAALLPLVWAYALFASAGAPVLRAALMVSLFHLGSMTSRKAGGAAGLAAAALVLLVADPSGVRSPSLLLSFAAVLGILLFSRGLGGAARALVERTGLLGGPLAGLRAEGAARPARRWRDRAKRSAGALLLSLAGIGSVSVAATVATMPLAFLFFENAPLAGVASNMAGVPAFTLAVFPVDLLCAALGLAGLLPAAAAGPVEALHGAFFAFARLAASAPVVPAGPLPGLAASLLLAAALGLALGRRLRWGALALGAGAALLVLPVGIEKARRWRCTRGRLAVVFPDVGQGDAALVRTPEGRHLLVDAGPTAGGAELARVVGRWTGRVDLLVVTHRHADHFGGAARLLDEGVEIVEMWTNGGSGGGGDDGFDELAAAVERGGGTVRAPPCGTILRWGVELTVLWPCADGGEGGEAPEGENDRSLVLRLRRGKAAFLFTGDIGTEAEEAVAARGELSAQVLKVPHHGSRHSSGGAMTGWSGLALAVVTAGAGNRFGFPSPSVIAAYGRAGVALLRVDESGAFILVADDRSIVVRDYRWEKVMELLL